MALSSPHPPHVSPGQFSYLIACRINECLVLRSAPSVLAVLLSAQRHRALSHLLSSLFLYFSCITVCERQLLGGHCFFVCVCVCVCSLSFTRRLLLQSSSTGSGAVVARSSRSSSIRPWPSLPLFLYPCVVTSLLAEARPFIASLHRRRKAESVPIKDRGPCSRRYT
jgi:hypothetical protein